MRGIHIAKVYSRCQWPFEMQFAMHILLVRFVLSGYSRVGRRRPSDKENRKARINALN
ncbi:hypothetical protein ACFLQ0_04870 [Nitrospinota bacterium]